MRTAGGDGPSAYGEFGTHDGLLYRTSTEYIDGVTTFLQPGLRAGDPVFVAVPAANGALLRRHLPADAGVQFADMTTIGRNPARIIPAIKEFLDAHPRRRVRFVGEPIWPGRSPAEICEATRHEALLNTVFSHTAVDILCPYDVGGLHPETVADAWRTHPAVIADDTRCVSETYCDPASMYDAADPLLPAAPTKVEVVPIRPGELPWLRDVVRAQLTELGLMADRIRDVVLAVNEIAVNTLVHTTGPGTLQIWRESRSVICEIRDGGHVTDPLAGRHRPGADAVRGRGLWMANQLCDLLQWRSTESGMTVRLHFGHSGA